MRTSLRTRIALTLSLFAALSALLIAAGALVFSPTPGVLFAIVAFITLGAWFLGRIAARLFVAPVERLGVAATAFASGNHAARADVTGPREMRIIAEAFNQMAAAVD